MEDVKNRLLFRSAVHRMVWLYGVPTATIAVLYAIRLGDVSLTQVVLAWLLFLLPWRSYVRWREGGREELPIFAMLGFMFWVTYGLPVFLEEHVLFLLYKPEHHVPDEAITYAVLMPLVGVSFLWLGMKAGIGRLIAPRTLVS